MNRKLITAGLLWLSVLFAIIGFSTPVWTAVTYIDLSCRSTPVTASSRIKAAATVGLYKLCLNIDLPDLPDPDKTLEKTLETLNGCHYTQSLSMTTDTGEEQNFCETANDPRTDCNGGGSFDDDYRPYTPPPMPFRPYTLPPTPFFASSRRVTAAATSPAFGALAQGVRAFALNLGRSYGRLGGQAQRIGTNSSLGADNLGVSENTAQKDVCLVGKKLCGAQGKAAIAFSSLQWLCALAAAIICTRGATDAEARPHDATGMFAALAIFAGLITIALAGNVNQLLTEAYSGIPPVDVPPEITLVCDGTLPGSKKPHPGYSFVLCILAWLLQLVAFAVCLYMRRHGALGSDAAAKQMSAIPGAYVALGEEPVAQRAQFDPVTGAPLNAAAAQMRNGQ